MTLQAPLQNDTPVDPPHGCPRHSWPLMMSQQILSVNGTFDKKVKLYMTGFMLRFNLDVFSTIATFHTLKSLFDLCTNYIQYIYSTVHTSQRKSVIFLWKSLTLPSRSLFRHWTKKTVKYNKFINI